MTLRLHRLILTEFRSYADAALETGAGMVVLTGANGAGKTNLLEAISLLGPGRGLRGARVAELGRAGAAAWGVAGRFSGAWGDFEIGTGTPPDGPAERRVFRLDGTPARSQAELAERLATVWLTPQMDRLFQEGASGRRRFLDRLAWALQPGHAREVAAYDNAMAQRNRVLAANGDPAWLAGLEDAMARHGVAASAARRALVTRLDEALAAGAVGGFPPARLALRDSTAAGPALAADAGADPAALPETRQAQAALSRHTHRLARALAHVINLLDPDVIVLGGGLSNLPHLYGQVPRLWGQWVFSDVVATRLERATHGDSSGVLGAARLW